MLLKVSRQNDACIMLVKRAIGHHWSIIGASLHHHPSIIRAVSWHEASLCHTPTLLSNSTSFIRSIYMCGPPIFEEVFLFLSCHVWVVWLTYPQGRHLSNVSFTPSNVSFSFKRLLHWSPSLIICVCLLHLSSVFVLDLWYVSYHLFLSVSLACDMSVVSLTCHVCVVTQVVLSRRFSSPYLCTPGPPRLQRCIWR